MNLLEPCLFLALYCCINRRQWTESCMRRQVSHSKAVLTSSNNPAVTMEWSRKTIFPTHRLKRHSCPCKTCAINKTPVSGSTSVVLTEGWTTPLLLLLLKQPQAVFLWGRPTESWEQTPVCCVTVPIKSWSNLTAYTEKCIPYYST